jgi:hypothetical protein
VREGDSPLDLARAFVAKHALPEAIIPALGQHLMDNIRESLAGKEEEQLLRASLASKVRGAARWSAGGKTAQRQSPAAVGSMRLRQQLVDCR